MSEPRPRVLVVDDEPDIRTVVGLNLGLSGLDYAEAEDGERCLEALKTDKWDGMILDLMMPNVDGIGVLKAMHEEAHDPLAIVVLSARHSPQIALQALELGAHAHLAKPFAPVAVGQLVQELISMTPEEREARRVDSITRAVSLDRLGMPSI